MTIARPKPWCVRIALALVAAMVPLLTMSTLHGASLSIENRWLSVVCDTGSRTFTISDKRTGRAFVTNGRLAADFARVDVTPDAIVVTQSDGSIASLALRDDQPFVFLTKRLAHRAAATANVQDAKPIDVASTVLATFTIDLGKPAAELTTMGTGGLMAADKNRGSYLFLTCADPPTRHGVVAGWVTHDRGSGVLFSSVREGSVEFKAQLDYGRLRIDAGQSAQLETLAVGYFDDARLGEEQFADVIAQHYHIQLKPPLAGYCTWYDDKHAGAGDEVSIVEQATLAARELKSFGFSFIQIDDEWQDGGKFNGPRRGFQRVKPDGPYPHGMQPIAAKIHDLGLIAGIWFMPFARNHQDEEYKDRQHWFVKRENGLPYETDWGGTSLDVTHPEVKTHLTELVKTIKSWGFRYFKLDGLWTGTATEQIYVNDHYKDDHIGNNAPFHDRTKTNIEAYRDGLKLLREAAGPEVFFSGCNISQNMRSLGGSIGLVDSMRIGPDNGSEWAGVVTPVIHGTPLYFLNGRVWWNDPDPYYVRTKLPLHEARVLPSWVAITGSFCLSSDWLPDLPADRIEIMKRIMPAHRAVARPVDYFDQRFATTWLVTHVEGSVRRDVIGLFNYGDSEMKVEETCERLGLVTGKHYHAFDFWQNGAIDDFEARFAEQVPPRSCRVIAVRADEGHPVVLSTSRHLTQGIVDLTEELWHEGMLSGTSSVVGGDAYELRIAGLEDGGKEWKLRSAEVSASDLESKVAIESTMSQGIARVTLRSPTSRNVRWQLRFDAESR